MTATTAFKLPVRVGVLVALVLALVGVAQVRPAARASARDRGRSELNRRAGDAYVDVVCILRSARTADSLSAGFVDQALGSYERSTARYPADTRAALSRALLLSYAGSPKEARQALVGVLRAERDEGRRTAARTVYLTLAAKRPTRAQVEAMERASSGTVAGALATSEAYAVLGDAEAMQRTLDGGYAQARRLVPVTWATIGIAGALLLAALIGLASLLLSRLRKQRGAVPVSPPSATWNVPTALEALAVFVLLQLVLATAAAALRPERAYTPLFMLVPPALAGLGAIFWVRLQSPGGTFGWRVDHPLRRTLTGLAAGGGALAAAYLAAALMQAVFKASPQEHPLVPVLAASSGLGEKLLLIVGACALLPVLEETLFRGIFYGALRRHWGVVGSVLASAVVFAAAHQDPAALLPYLLVGVVLAWLYERSGSLLTVTVAHAAFNLFGVMLALVMYG
jgi:membrane protease YdiL (CAAX protease family)